MGTLVTKDDFDTDSRNPRFVAYLIAKGLKPGDTWKSYEFMIWCNEIVRDYREAKGLAKDARYDQDDLSEWIEKKVGIVGANEQLSLF
ncbi:hypothetical protein CHH65_13955 [Shouchella clausii]|uniref:hypothetical protein n=1 Tax=Shouchella clausii TaxID=79880 RepID=UPI000BA6CCA8|nr:hypothetical protein [Shouchella clausii]PAF08687.1 hypothetical protein CHH65_13955 [Shouchella clausii]